MLSRSNRVPNEKHFVFYGQLVSSDGSVEHAGDDRKGGSGADDEQVRANLSQVSVNIEELVVVVTIHEATERRQNFGMVDRAYPRIVDAETDREVARYGLSEDFSIEDAVDSGNAKAIGLELGVSCGWRRSFEGSGPSLREVRHSNHLS